MNKRWDIHNILLYQEWDMGYNGKERKEGKILQIQQIQSFVMLCREKNISKCSEKLHISQQGLSRQIKAMEQELGATLFIRTTKGVELTGEGELLLPGFKKAMDVYSQSLRELKDYQKSHQETVRISVCPGIKPLLGLEFFTEFQANNPGVHLKLEFHSDVECENDLYSGNVDAAFLDWPEHSDEYDTYMVVNSHLVAVMRKDHELSERKSLSMKDLEGRSVYIPDDSHRMTQRFIRNWPEFYKSVVIDFTTNEYESFYRDLPKKAGGIALTFRYLCDDLDPELTFIPIEEESYLKLYYCVRKDRAAGKGLSLFSDYVYRNVDVSV